MEDTRKVRLEFSLVGKSYDFKRDAVDMKTTEIHSNVLNKIGVHFGNRPTYTSRSLASVLKRGAKYPDYYAAGWFVSSSPVADTNGLGSELLVIAHGSSMEDAKNNLMSTVTTAPWDQEARNF